MRLGLRLEEGPGAGDVWVSRSGIDPTWGTRDQNEELMTQLEPLQAERQQLQQELAKEQRVRAGLEKTLAQATSSLQNILQVNQKVFEH